jgi:hypothetical protein
MAIKTTMGTWEGNLKGKGQKLNTKNVFPLNGCQGQQNGFQLPVSLAPTGALN